MKKIAIVLALLLCVTALTACNGRGKGEHTKPAVPTLAETPAETPEESPIDSDAPDASEPDASETEPEETEPEEVSESETYKKGTVELPRDEF